jgi:hypothetical protein
MSEMEPVEFFLMPPEEILKLEHMRVKKLRRPEFTYEQLIEKADLCFLAAFRIWERNRDQKMINMWMSKRAALMNRALECIL